MSEWHEMRERAGMTRRKLAAKLGVSQDTVRQWEQDPQKEPALAYQRQMEAMIDGHDGVTKIHCERCQTDVEPRIKRALSDSPTVLSCPDCGSRIGWEDA